MYSLALGKRAAAPAQRMDTAMLPSSLVTEAPVGNVAVVPSVTRRYRAVLSRSVTLKTVVEFDAPETADTYAMAQSLGEQVPFESYEVVDQGYSYVDKVEPLDEAPASVIDPLGY